MNIILAADARNGFMQIYLHQCIKSMNQYFVRCSAIYDTDTTLILQRKICIFLVEKKWCIYLKKAFL